MHQDWIWIFIFEKNWIRTGSGYLFDFYNEISLRVIQEYQGIMIEIRDVKKAKPERVAPSSEETSIDSAVKLNK